MAERLVTEPIARQSPNTATITATNPGVTNPSLLPAPISATSTTPPSNSAFVGVGNQAGPVTSSGTGTGLGSNPTLAQAVEAYNQQFGTNLNPDAPWEGANWNNNTNGTGPVGSQASFNTFLDGIIGYVPDYGTANVTGNSTPLNYTPDPVTDPSNPTSNEPPPVATNVQPSTPAATTNGSGGTSGTSGTSTDPYLGALEGILSGGASAGGGGGISPPTIPVSTTQSTGTTATGNSTPVILVGVLGIGAIAYFVLKKKKKPEEGQK